MPEQKSEKVQPKIAFSFTPLIVAVLTALICLSIGLAIYSQNLSANLNRISIAFLILFAIVGLAVSIWLILRESRREIVSRENEKRNWKLGLPENQRSKLNREVRELAKVLDVSAENMSDLLSAYIVAQDLALRQVQQEAGIPLKRNVKIGNSVFDAVYTKEDWIICVWVNFLVEPLISLEKIDEISKKIADARKSLAKDGNGSTLKLQMVLVTQLDEADEELLRSSLHKNLFLDTPADVEINLFDFAKLQKTYAMD